MGMNVQTFKAHDETIDKFVELTGKPKSTAIRELIIQFNQDPRNMKHDLNEMIELSNLMTLQEVADKFDVCVATVWNWINRDGMDHIRKGKTYLLHISHIIDHFDISGNDKKMLQNKNIKKFLQKYKTPKQIQQEYDLPRYKISRLKKKKILRTIPIGKRRYLIHEDSVKFYLEQQEKIEIKELDE